MSKSELWDKLKEELEKEAEGFFNYERGAWETDWSHRWAHEILEKMERMEILGK